MESTPNRPDAHKGHPACWPAGAGVGRVSGGGAADEIAIGEGEAPGQLKVRGVRVGENLGDGEVGGAVAIASRPDTSGTMD